MKRVLLVWAALIGLALATLAFAFVPLGPGNLAVALLIAAIKAGLVVLLFMELGRDPPLARIAAAAGLFFLTLLFALAFSDLATRALLPVG